MPLFGDFGLRVRTWQLFYLRPYRLIRLLSPLEDSQTGKGEDDAIQ